MQLITVRIDNRKRRTSFSARRISSSVEDLHEALVTAAPGIKFGLGFCEASGKCLVRWSGTDAGMIELAKQNAAAIAAGHSFIVFLGEGFHPLNVLNTLKMVPEVCRIFCATANPGASLASWTGWPRRASRTRPRPSGERFPAADRLQAVIHESGWGGPILSLPTTASCWKN